MTLRVEVAILQKGSSASIRLWLKEQLELSQKLVSQRGIDMARQSVAHRPSVNPKHQL